MKNFTLFQGVLFGLFGLAALIGLFVFATHSSNTASTNKIGTVVIWGTLPASGMTNVLTAIKQNNQDFKDVSYVQKDAASLPTELASAIATGAAPDLVLASQEELQPLAKLLTPIPLSTLSASTFTSSFVREGSLFTVPNAGGYYGVPFVIDPLVLFSNRAILSSDGIAKPPTTWEALTGLAPVVAQLTPSKQITRGLIALGTYDNVHDARGILSALFLQTGVPISTVKGGALTADLHGSGTVGSSNASAGQAVLTYYTQFADPSKVSYSWNASLQDSQQAFLAGDLALYLGYASEAAFLTQANPNLDFVVTPLPQQATASTKSTFGLLYAFMIPRGAPNTAGAFQVAATLTGTDAQAVAAKALNLAPALLTSLATPPSDPMAAIAYQSALYAEGWLSPLPSQTDQIFSGMINDVISGRLSTDAALSTSEQSLTALLQK